MKTPSILSIPPAQFPKMDSLAAAIDEAVGRPSPSLGSEQPDASKSHEMSKALILLAGQIWRLGNAVINSESGEVKTELSPQEIKRVASARGVMQQTIDELGIKVIDHCNEDFHPGLPDQVVTEEPREGITKEQVIRTIRPTIMWNQTMMQRGQIDIAVPASKN